MRGSTKKSLFIHLPVFNDLPVETSVSTFVYKGQERVVMYPDTECQDHSTTKGPLVLLTGTRQAEPDAQETGSSRHCC